MYFAPDFPQCVASVTAQLVAAVDRGAEPGHTLVRRKMRGQDHVAHGSLPRVPLQVPAALSPTRTAGTSPERPRAGTGWWRRSRGFGG